MSLRGGRNSAGLLFPILLLLALLSPLPAAAEESGVWDHILATRLIRFGLPGDYAPFALAPAASQPETGKAGDERGWQGLDVELLSRFAARHHLRPLFVKTSWHALAADLANGRFEVAGGGVSVTPERAKIGLFSTPYLEDGKTVLAPCATAARFGRLEDIDRPGVRVLVNPGGTNEAFDRSRLRQARLILWKDNRSIFAALAAGKGDLMITDAVEARYQAHHTAGLCAPFAAHPFTRSAKAFLLAPDPRLKAAFDQFLNEERRSGRLAALLSRRLD